MVVKWDLGEWGGTFCHCPAQATAWAFAVGEMFRHSEGV